MRMRACALVASVLMFTVQQPALSQAYPSKPIHIIDAFAPGGITELLARLIGQKLSESWGQPVLVEAKPGAGANIGIDAVAKAAPDGYTLIVVPGLFTTNISLYNKLSWDPVRDFAPLSLLARTPVILVINPSVLNVGSVKELIVYAKTNPGKLNFASGGTGATPHLAGELFKAMAGIDMTHVPYKGTAPAMTDLVAGQVHLSFSSPLTAMPYVKNAKLRALATSGAQRSATLPELPTIAEAGLPGYEVISWFGMLAPARTPSPIVSKLSGEIVKTLQLADVRERCTNVGLEIIGSTPEQMAAFVKEDIAKWAKVFEDAKIPGVD